MEEKLKIFFCEDDENLGMLLREYLQAKGYVTDLFSDGEAGYKGFTKGKYDLCVLDVMMPKKDGFTLAQEIRSPVVMEEKLKIFFCEDDENLGMLLREYLQAKGYVTDLFSDGEAGYKGFTKGKYDLCVLDVMMPKKDGFTLAQEIRSINPDIPIIFLTAKTMKEDILEGFKIGADDYLTKPFSMEELLLRIEAILRRVKGKKMKDIPFYKLGNFLFDTQKQTLAIGDKVTKLTTKECELLSLLCAHANEILERNYALKTIWVDDNYFNARSMDVYITKLRKLLKDDPGIEIINIHGKGYKLITPSGEEQAREEGIQVL